MHFASIAAVALATMASALPLESGISVTNGTSLSTGSNLSDLTNEDLSLPAGCTKENLIKCVLHLASIGGSCGGAAAEGGINIAMDLACVGASSSTAANIDECKSCIPQA